MPNDPRLLSRGRLVRALATLQEMLPGSFVERRHPCGKPNCRCADGQHLHTQYQLSVSSEGKLSTYNVPAEHAGEVWRRVELRQRFERVAVMIANLNLRRWLRQSRRTRKQP